MSEPNLYKREGVWQLRTTIKGVECRESLRTSDVKVARKRRDARIEEIKASAHFDESVISWKQAVAAWSANAFGNLGLKTLKRYAVSLGQVEPFLGHLSVGQVDAKVISGIVAARQQAGTTHATIRRDLTAVSRVLEFAETEGWCNGNPTLGKRRLLKEKRNPIMLPEQVDIEAVIQACSPLFAALVRAAELTGCRQDELVTVTWKDFDPANRQLAVIGKGNKRRFIELSEDAANLLATQPKREGVALIFARDDGSRIAEASSDYSHFARTAAQRAAKAGVKFRHFRFHDLRHLYAVRELKNGRGIYTLSKHLGHTSVKTTEQHYLTFLTPEEADRAMK